MAKRFIFESLTHKLGDEFLVEVLRKYFYSNKSKLKTIDFFYNYALDINVNVIINSTLLKLKKSKKLLGDFDFELSPNYFIFYDESEFSERENFKICFKSINFELLYMIREFIDNLKKEKVELVVIFNESVTELTKHENIFSNNGITLLKTFSDCLEGLKVVNIYTYKFNECEYSINKNMINLSKIPISKSLKLISLTEFNNENSNYIILTQDENIDLISNKTKTKTIIISGTSIEQSKIIRRYLEKLEKLYEVSRENEFKFITIGNLFISITNCLEELKFIYNLNDIIEKIYLKYKILKDLNKFQSLRNEDTGKM